MFDTFDSAKGAGWAPRLGYFFTDQHDFATMFGSRVFPVYLRLLQPKRVTPTQWNNLRERHAREPAWWARWTAPPD